MGILRTATLAFTMALSATVPALTQDTPSAPEKKQTKPALPPGYTLNQDDLRVGGDLGQSLEKLPDVLDRLPGIVGSIQEKLEGVDGVISGVPGDVIGGVIGGVPGGVIGGVPSLAELPYALANAKEALAGLSLRGPLSGKLGYAFDSQKMRTDEDDRSYERGQRDLERNRWDQAAASFSAVAGKGGARADGALYWKAYALNKLGRRDDALAALAELRKTYPNSRWMDDAKALEIEVRQASGQHVSPESAGDEDLKLMALNGLMNSDPDHAVPLLEKLLHSTQSPKIKERALFVLTQSGSPQARGLVLQMAKGASNTDLQMKAVNYLGVMGAQKELGEVYTAASDTAVKRAVLHALMVSGAHDQLLAAAKSEKNPDLRRDAIHQLGNLSAHGDLWQLYQAEPTVEIKREIVHALMVGDDTEHLLEIARSGKEIEVRRDAIHALGNLGEKKTGDALSALYASEPDLGLRKEIIHSLFVSDNPHALVAIARKETNMDLKKEIVRALSNMQSKEGTDYLMELLNK